MGKEAKTNAMRILERAKVAYTAHEYPHEEGVAVDGIHVAQSMGEDPACVYKTLVTQGASRNYFVFVIPVAAELDLKAAARSVGEKSVAMIHVADINKVTGYVRGGCSPVGMKKQYTTVFDESVLAQEKVYVSGGRIGTQVCCAPADLIKAARATTAHIIFRETLSAACGGSSPIGGAIGRPGRFARCRLTAPTQQGLVLIGSSCQPEQRSPPPSGRMNLRGQ